MSKQLNEIFHKKLDDYIAANGKFPDKMTHTCDCCGVTFICYRRDLTYVMVTFLMALRDMSLADNEQYHYYRDAVTYAYEHWKCTPTDYPLLQHWKLTKSLKGESKMKCLTEAGYNFLNNILAVPKLHFRFPHDNIKIWSKKKTLYIELYNQYLKDKEEKEPFLEIK